MISQSSIVLENGGYTDIVVAIDESLKENDALVQAIQRMFIDGSGYLYQATRKRVYFKSITIIIPSTWSTKAEYRSPGRLTFDDADVRIAPPNSLWAPNPYTHQVQGCGKPGSYIHFIEEFLTSSETKDTFGPLGRVLIHEWGHLRWGLFNEYPDPVGDQKDIVHYYQSMEDEKWKPVACNQGIYTRALIKDESNDASDYRGCEGNEDDGYEEGCMAITSGPGLSTGSIMYGLLKFDQIQHFCDNDKSDPDNLHNREAPNKHNRLCNSRSAWEVMREHEDFKDNISPPLDLSDADILPSFTLAQARIRDECRIVIVIDTSGSMDTSDRILKAISASTAFIDLVNEETWVGIVTFTSSTSIRHGLIQVSSQADRSALRDTLSFSADGGTCIGCGLESGLQVLGEHPSGILSGADILLMTDGEDAGFATHPARQTAIEEGVRINTVAIGDDAYGKLNTVSLETGGLGFSYRDNDGRAELITALTQTAETCSGTDTSKGRVQLSSVGFTLGTRGVTSGHFYIDPSIGSGTQFIVTYTHGSDIIPGVILTLTQPNGKTISPGSFEYNEDAQRKVISVFINGRAEIGKWFYEITNTFPGTHSVTFSVYSRPNNEVQDGSVISVKSYISDSVLNQSEDIKALVTYAEVMKGSSPVINATVRATVERPGGVAVTYDLLDNGAGADVTANDGVYTRSFLNYTGEGFYGIGITAENDGSALILKGKTGSQAPAFINITEDGQVVSDGSIGNYTIRLPGDQVFDSLVFEKAAPFTRSSSAGSTNVPSLPQGFTPGQDLFPPNRVQDLRVKLTSLNESSVVLTWTAPGDDLDTGTAMSYDIRISHSPALLLANFSNATQLEFNQILEGNVSSPKPFGSLEEYVITVPDVTAVTTFSYAFALQASDDAGLTSPVSNVVKATFRRVIPTSPPPKPGPCDSMVCYNGGTLDERRCLCSCSDEFPGEYCEYVKSQLKNGVQVDLRGNQDEWQDSAEPLLASVTEQLNLFCTNNFDTCCPGRGQILSKSLRIQFVTVDDVKIADGYPVIEGKEEDDDQLYTCSFIVYALKPAGPDVCSDASGPLSRWRRGDHSNVQRRSAEPIYISQDLLLDAILNGRAAIASYLINATSKAISIANITLPIEEENAVPTDSKPEVSNRSMIVITIVCILIIGIIICLLGVAYYYKRCRKNASYQAARKDDQDDV
ncbi:calcium-activated chloride channel regulator 1 isoform X2 [Strongylocentrotus purpuratus]|nr:calcium-activated chloride channel regulator 1 isoform X2 [Strongylocentrotus purpuratus]